MEATHLIELQVMTLSQKLDLIETYLIKRELFFESNTNSETKQCPFSALQQRA